MKWWNADKISCMVKSVAREMGAMAPLRIYNMRSGLKIDRKKKIDNFFAIFIKLKRCTTYGLDPI